MAHLVGFFSSFFYAVRNFQGVWPKTLGRVLALFFIRIYQICLSRFIGGECRHFPTCSEYSYEAIARHGFFIGFFLTVFRFFRCGPFGYWCIDPVPIELPDTLFFRVLKIFLHFFSKFSFVFLYLCTISSYIVLLFFFLCIIFFLF